jgi:hypothetical protein
LRHSRLWGCARIDPTIRIFEYIEAQIARFRAAGHPIISVDTKKKELIGEFKNKPGRVG